MVTIAITGGIACGKSLVGQVLVESGLPVCETDELARRVVAPGTRALSQIVESFGKRVLLRDGSLDRAALARRVFARPRDLARLNAIVHPGVKRAWKRWLRERAAANDAAAAVIVPLLFEVGEGGGWGAVVCVTSTAALQVQRLKARGLAERDARRRMAAQMSTDEKAEKSDYVIVNNGTEAVLREQTVRVAGHIRER